MENSQFNLQIQHITQDSNLMENSKVCNYWHFFPYDLNQVLQWCLLLRQLKLCSVWPWPVSATGHTATAFPGLLFNSVLPYQTHLRTRMANLNPLGHLLPWDEDVIPIFTYNNITSAWYLNMADSWWSSLGRWCCSMQVGMVKAHSTQMKQGKYFPESQWERRKKQ